MIMKLLQLRLLVAVLLCILSGCVERPRASHTSPQQMIVDMAARKIKVPAKIERIFCADWTCTMFIYSLSPEKLVARNTKPTAQEIPFTLPAFQKLPEVGVIINGRSTINVEELARLNPDIIVCPLFQHTQSQHMAEYERVSQLLNKPFVMIDLDLEKLPDAYQFMGKLLGCEDDAQKLQNYCFETLSWADSVRSNIKKPKTIYVAEGVGGLNTIPLSSTHSQTLSEAGAINCANVYQEYGYKDITIGFEQIIGWDPDYILVNSRSVEQMMNTSLLQSDRWQSLRAVKQGHVLVTPVAPYNWIGRPPGINRLIGIKWLAWSLYPDVAKTNMPTEIKNFFNLFYHVKPTDSQIDEIVKNFNLAQQ